MFDISIVDGMFVPVIVVAALCIGYVIKTWLPTDNKWIPTILLIFGAVSGAILFGCDYEGIVKGAVSGLAATGLHQAFKQHLQMPPIQSEFNLDEIVDENGNEVEANENQNDKTL